MGLVVSFLSLLTRTDERYPPEPKWSPSDLPDLSGKVMIVTGGNAGQIPLRCERRVRVDLTILSRDRKDDCQGTPSTQREVYIAARSRSKCLEAIEELRSETGKEALFLELDLADLRSIKACAEEFLRKETELHVLYNNAGLMQPPIDQLTAQGFDLQFGVNVIGHFYLTKLLLPTLLSTAKTSPEKHARVVNISSVAHVQVPCLNFNTFKDSPTRQKFIYRLPGILYGQSKFGNAVFAIELARRYGDQGIVSTCVHPGAFATGLWVAGAMPNFVTAVANILMFQNIDYAAYTQLYAGADPAAANLNGQYLIPWARVGKIHRNAEDPVLGRQLWEYMEEQVKHI